MHGLANIEKMFFGEVLLNEHERFVHRLFSRIAIRYDWMNKIISFNMDKSWRRHTIDLAEPLLGQQWLDVCSGTGKLALGLADRVGATGRVVGLDFNADMLAVARKNEQFQRGAVSVEWIEGNAMQMPFLDDSFDGATIGFGLRNLPDLAAGLAEMIRVVKPGGKIVILDASHPVWPFFRQGHHFFVFVVLPWLGKWGTDSRESYAWLGESLSHFPGSEELAKILKSCGLEQVRFERLFGGVAAIHLGIVKGKDSKGES